MTETLVPAVRTPCTAAQLYAALAADWQAVVGGTPTHDALVVLLAQSAFETGHWSEMWCQNIGNAKHVVGDGRDFYQIRCNEFPGGKEEWFDPPNPATSFRAFPTLAAGAVDYLALLHREFTSAWAAVLAGDPATFVHELKLHGYFTGDEATYSRNVVTNFAAFSRAIPTVAPTSPPPPAAIALSAILTANVEIDESVHDDPPPAAA